MNKFTKILGLAFLAAFLIAGSAFGITVGNDAPNSSVIESITMIFLGLGLIAFAGIIKAVFKTTNN